MYRIAYNERLAIFHKDSKKCFGAQPETWEHPFYQRRDRIYSGIRNEDGSYTFEFNENDVDLSSENLKKRFEYYSKAAEVVSEPEELEEDEEGMETLPTLYELASEDDTGFYRDLIKHNEFLGQVKL